MSDREILYIEDNFHNRRIVRKILERQGYTLHEREDGFAGYEFLKELKPGVVLLDISLPTMDGMEIARRVKEDPEVQHIYLIALTASAMQGDRERFLEAGCDDYLSKPFRALDLVDLVNKYADLVEKNVPAPLPQSSEMHDTRPLEIEKKETAPEPVEVETQGQHETTAEAVIEMEAVFEAEIEDAVEVEVELDAEETIAAEHESIVEEAELTDDLVEEAAPVAAGFEEAETEIAVEVAKEAEVVPVLEQAGEGVEEPAAVEKIETTSLEQESSEAEPAVEQDEPSSAWELEKDVVDFQQAESDRKGLSDTAELLDVEEPVADTKAEQAPSSPSEVEALAKKNGNPGYRKQKNPEKIDAIKAGIKGVINPDNLKPVDPNNHHES